MTNEKQTPAPAKDSFDARDWIGLLGLVLTTTGAYFVYPPAALLVPGVILLLLAAFGGR